MSQTPRAATDANEARDANDGHETGSPPVPRRAVLKTLVISSLLATAGGALALVRSRGYALRRTTPLLSLAPWEARVVEQAARRIAAPDRPGDRTIPSADDVDVVGFVDRYVARLAPPLRRDLSRAFLYLEQVAPLTIGRFSRFTQLSSDEQDRVLEKLERSPVVLLRGAFAGIKSLVFMGYYRDARTWGMLGYSGPWLDSTRGDSRDPDARRTRPRLP